MPVSVLCSNQPASDELCKVSNSCSRSYLRFGCLCVPPGLSQTVLSENHPLVWIFIEGNLPVCQKTQINIWQYECGKKEGRRAGNSTGWDHMGHMEGKPEEDNPVSRNFFHPPAKIALLCEEALCFPSSFYLLCSLLPLQIPFSLSGLVENSSLFVPSCFAPCLPWVNGANDHTHHTSEQGHGAASRSCFWHFWLLFPSWSCTLPAMHDGAVFISLLGILLPEVYTLNTLSCTKMTAPSPLKKCMTKTQAMYGLRFLDFILKLSQCLCLHLCLSFFFSVQFYSHNVLHLYVWFCIEIVFNLLVRIFSSLCAHIYPLQSSNMGQNNSRHSVYFGQCL